MKRLLAIETSGEACSVALSIGEEVRENYQHAPMRHAELLLPAVRSLLDEAGIKPGQLDAIVFGRGPGSFTSLRIGVGVVQGLAWGAELPVVPVSSLAAVAQQALDGASDTDLPVVVAMDARMEEVFCGSFHPGGDGMVAAKESERVCAPGLLDAGEEPFIAAGNGFDRYPDLAVLKGRAVACYPELWPRASTVIRLAENWLKVNEALPAAMAQPVYIRNEVASKPAS